MRYKLTLSYRGEAFAGWQRQNHALTVQQVVEEAVGELVGRPTVVTASGRTDAGVHARAQVAHLDLDRCLPDTALVEGVNTRLPADVRILQAEPVGDDFHAQFSAVGKEYRYAMTTARVQSPIDSLFCLRLKAPIPHLEAMRSAARLFEGEWDFTAFAKSGGTHTQPVRRIFRSELCVDGEEMSFRVIGQGFLRGMVRAMVGTLLEIGYGRQDSAGLLRLLGGRPRSEAGSNVAPHGLVLFRVFYDMEELRREAGRRSSV